jgi:PHP family Zn ribbon phosphoesterase
MKTSRLIDDLHLQSRFSIATSPKLNIQSLTETTAAKGIDLVAAPDFTHPTWHKEMRLLEPAGDGVYGTVTALVYWPASGYHPQG